jgi:uncharacterized surface protein with fasciclin (FAS1) repeats
VKNTNFATIYEQSRYAVTNKHKNMKSNFLSLVFLAVSALFSTAQATAAGLVETLQSKGPFTVFAPVNAAFAKLPEGTVATLLKPENKATLTKVLTYHVIAGNLDAAAVVKAITDGGGKVEVTTVSGGKLTVSLKDGKVILTDENGGVATVLVTDLKGDNGVIHVIDSVVLPK